MKEPYLNCKGAVRLVLLFVFAQRRVVFSQKFIKFHCSGDKWHGVDITSSWVRFHLTVAQSSAPNEIEQRAFIKTRNMISKVSLK